jgi:molybdate transport system regulatory protein
MTSDPRLKIKAQIRCGDDFAIGPGKAALLDAIAAHGSISAAGRALGMSYRRAWLLVDSMNRCWRVPLVTTAHGGLRGGGARLTVLGVEVLGRYRALEAAIDAAAAGPAAALLADLRMAPLPPHP